MYDSLRKLTHFTQTINIYVDLKITHIEFSLEMFLIYNSKVITFYMDYDADNT